MGKYPGAIKKGQQSIEEEKKAEPEDPRPFELLDIDTVKDGWWKDYRADGLLINCREEISEEWLQTIKDNVFSDGSHRLEHFEIGNLKVIDRKYGYENDITTRVLDEFLYPVIHREADAYKNVCKTFIVDARKIEPKSDWYM